MKSKIIKKYQDSLKRLFLFFGMLLLILPTVLAFGEQASDPWLEEMEKARGLSVGDLEPRFGDLPPAPDMDDSTGTSRDDETTAGTVQDDDISDTERTGPVNPDTLDPRNPRVANYIREWTSTAKPPENAIPGSNWRYDSFGRVVGSGPGLRTTSTHDSVDYGGGIPETRAWHLRKELDSIDHCTLEEYVVARLKNESINHCAGRYGALKDLKGLRLKEAKAEVTAAGFKYDDPVPGSPAKTAEANGTIERQEPGPNQYLKKGQFLKLVVHTPYVPGQVKLPDFIGKSLGESKKWLKKNRLKMRLQPGSPAPTKQKSGTIETQKPVAGTVMKAGGRVVFTVHSKYVDTRKVPKVVGLSAGKAKEFIEKAGLKTDPKPAVEKPSSKEQAKTVARQSPIAGTSVSPGTEVSIFVYGPFVDTTIVPDVSKLSYEDAKQRLKAAGLAMTREDAGGPNNRNLARTAQKQDPLPGTEISRGKPVFVWFYGPYVPTREEQVAAKDCTGYPGSRAYWDDAAGQPKCGCFDGLERNIANTACVSPDVRNRELCEKERPGSIPTGRDANGQVNCGCPQGYVWDSDQQKRCVQQQLSPEEICARSYPGSVPTGRNTNGQVNCGCPNGYVWNLAKTKCVTTKAGTQEFCTKQWPGSVAQWNSGKKKYECGCPNGYVWNSDRTRCVQQVSPQELCARNYPGSVPGGKDASGKVICNCPQGYIWNSGRTRCVKQVSPQELCARNYPGSVANGRTSDGKVNCECPQGYVWDSDQKRRCVRQQVAEPSRSCKVDTSLMIRSDGFCTTFAETRDPQGRLDPHGINRIVHIVHEDQFSIHGWRVPKGWLKGRYNTCEILLKDSQDGCAWYLR